MVLPSRTATVGLRAGVAMPLALVRRAQQGATFRQTFQHVAIRSLKLLLLSQILMCIAYHRLYFQMINVLAHWLRAALLASRTRLCSGIWECCDCATSHAVYISQPSAVAALIEHAEPTDK